MLDQMSLNELYFSCGLRSISSMSRNTFIISVSMGVGRGGCYSRRRALRRPADASCQSAKTRQKTSIHHAAELEAFFFSSGHQVEAEALAGRRPRCYLGRDRSRLGAKLSRYSLSDPSLRGRRWGIIYETWLSGHVPPGR